MRTAKKLETDLHQDDAADNTNHGQRHSEQAQDQCSKDQEEEAQQQRINACFPRHLTVCFGIFPFQQL